jgi:hypothetical protein
LPDITNLPCEAASFASLGTEILLLGKSLRFRAGGSSMQPLVRNGDILLVRPLELSRLRVGDIILCCSQPGRILAHRVVRRFRGPDGWSFQVQGDQVSQPDGIIPQAQVYGQVAAIERAGRHIDMQRPVMKFLGWLAVLRSRGQLGPRGWSRQASQLVRRLPIFSTYLS